MMWVYGLTDAASLPDVDGVDGRPLELVRAGDVGAVVSRHDARPTEATTETLWAHERAVEAVAETAAVVPARFGTALAGDDAVASMVRRNREHVVALLELVRARVELSLRIGGERRADAEALHRALAGRAVRSTSPVLRDGTWTVAFLVERAAVPSFVDALAAVAPRPLPTLTGPWPPYSFVADEELAS